MPSSQLYLWVTSGVVRLSFGARTPSEPQAVGAGRRDLDSEVIRCGLV